MNDDLENFESFPVTLPENLNVCLKGFDSGEVATRLGEILGAYLRELSKVFDLSGLDGITVATDYTKALQNLDRGYESNYQLTPSEGNVVGIAMTPCVIRDGRLKSHIVLSAAITEGINDVNGEKIQQFLQTLAHECAHVEINHKFDAAFPSTLLQHQYADERLRFRQDVSLACWNEFAATCLSAKIGQNVSAWYEESFLGKLNEAKSLASESIGAYLKHKNHLRVFSEVAEQYGQLLKLSAYYLGNLSGHGADPFSQEELSKRISGQWFEPFLKKLYDALQAIYLEHGAWKDQSQFEIIGDLAEDLLANSGITFHYSSDGALQFYFPH